MSTNLNAEDARNISNLALEKLANEQVTHAKNIIKAAAEQCFTSVMIEEKSLGKRARQLLQNDHYRVVFFKIGNAIRYKVMWNDDELDDVDAQDENDILIDYKRS